MKCDTYSLLPNSFLLMLLFFNVSLLQHYSPLGETYYSIASIVVHIRVTCWVVDLSSHQESQDWIFHTFF